MIVDDYRCDFAQFHFLLRLLDRYPLPVDNKGWFIYIQCKYIFITSPHPPALMFAHRSDSEDMRQLTRRIEESGGAIHDQSSPQSLLIL